MNRHQGTKANADRTTRRKATRRRDWSGHNGGQDRDRRDHRDGPKKVGASAERHGRSKGTGKRVVQRTPRGHRQNGGTRKMGKKMSVRTKQQEVDRNFAFFKAELPTILPQHMGKYALIRDKKIHGYFDTVVDAQTTGSKLFEDNLFSIQKVTNEIVDLGLFSHAVHLGHPQRA
jgi:hypothetical protein